MEEKQTEHTIFVGNLPTTSNRKTINQLFRKYGTIQTMRFRTNTGQKVSARYLKACPSLIAYVRFSSKEEVQRACEMNGQMVGENRIRVCPQDQKQIGKVSTTVFVGGLHNNTTENDLYEFFGKVGPIEYIRYLAEKHFAFVCFEKSVSAKKALKLNNTKLYKHEIRIEPIDAKRSNVKTNKKGHLVPRHKPPKVQSKETNDGAEPKQFHGQVSQKKSEKKRMSKKSGFGSLKEKRVLSKKLKSAAQAKV